MLDLQSFIGLIPFSSQLLRDTATLGCSFYHVADWLTIKLTCSPKIFKSVWETSTEKVIFITFCDVYKPGCLKIQN